ncbi:formyltetrahydrofolate deformylase [Mesorhizobium sp. Cs1299R1N3]|uniref:formyltetrahydrofolate deformylase n=1 Tax=Mesorhizobium sp. Cs1299R1N3 TaxID=3015173 RepID=UPI00301C1998
MRDYLLTLRCENRPGIVAAVASQLAAHGGDITEAQQFDDRETGRFFMRVAFTMSRSVDDFAGRFAEEVRRFDLKWTLRPANQLRKVLILVSKFDHCLVDLIYRRQIGELPMDLVGIVSNHPREALNLSHDADIPFHHFAISGDAKTEQENRIRTVIEDSGAELVVLARYMQILSDDFSAYLSGRCINIHHSFLPGFKGAKPYHQAYERGVKMIGATAHYVTEDLDEGPIISQDVEHVTHADSPDDLVRKGRDIERRVLARAVTFHLQDRVLLNGRKTVIFA